VPRAFHPIVCGVGFLFAFAIGVGCDWPLPSNEEIEASCGPLRIVRDEAEVKTVALAAKTGDDYFIYVCAADDPPTCEDMSSKDPRGTTNLVDDRCFLRFRKAGRHITFTDFRKQFDDRVRAAELTSRGKNRGDRVAICLKERFRSRRIVLSGLLEAPLCHVH
jgi:hypothetical protein